MLCRARVYVSMFFKYLKQANPLISYCESIELTDKERNRIKVILRICPHRKNSGDIVMICITHTCIEHA